MSEANNKKRVILAAFGIAGTLGVVGWAVPFFRKIFGEMNVNQITTTTELPKLTTNFTTVENTNSSIEIKTALQLLEKMHSNENVQKILENGCFCSWLEFGNYTSSIQNHTQITLNNIDKICKDWATARSCLKSSENSTCSNYLEEEYFIDNFDETTPSCQKQENSECQQLVCKVDLFHSKSILQFLRNDDFEFSNKNLEACVAGNNVTTRKLCLNSVNLYNHTLFF